MSDNYLPSRRSIRLKGYDYSKAGLYFITLCVQNRLNLFGKCLNLNDAGKMVERWYFELQNKYPNIRCHEMVVMPNHFHCIIEITDGNTPNNNVADINVTDAHVGAPLRGRPINDIIPEFTPNPYGPPDNKKYNATIGNMMDWFKTMTTNEYIRGVKNNDWPRFDRKLWQRNYWEHIIRNDGSYSRIAKYINENPSNWIDDQLNHERNISI